MAKTAFPTHNDATVWVDVLDVVVVTGPWTGQHGPVPMLGLWLRGGGSIAVKDLPETRDSLQVPR